MTKWDLDSPGREPLSPDERETVTQAASDGALITRFAVFGTLYAGASASELAHLTPRLVRSTGENRIRILFSGPVDCRAGMGIKNGDQWRRRGEAEFGERCGVCDGRYDGFRTRTVPVRHPEAASVIETVVSLHDGMPGGTTLHRRIDRLGERCGVDRLTQSVLYYTFPVILAEHGFTRVEIGEIMGYTEGKREDINFSGQVGPYCKDENPFICTAEINSGDTCERPAETGRDYCSHHVPSAVKCGALLEDGSRCEMLVSDPYETCHHHSSDEDVLTRCGAVLDDGSHCGFPVSGPDERCKWHTEDGPETCGEPLEDGTRCERQGSRSDGKCTTHSETGHRCGAETGPYVDGNCSKPVDSAGERCRHHTDS